MLESFCVLSTLTTRKEVTMMDKDHYIQHISALKRITPAEAEALWDEDFSNPDVIKEKANGQDLIAVPACKKYYFDTVIEIRRGIEKERRELRTQKELQSGHKRTLAMLGNSVINPVFEHQF